MRTETSTGRVSAMVHSTLRAEAEAARSRSGRQPHVVDVGGGSGVWAVPFAASGCRVTVVEPNPNALATLRRRAAEDGVAERITAVADDSDALGRHVPEGTADLILAHGLLEVVDEPEAAVYGLSRALAAGGALSVLAANRYGAVLQRALAGRLAQAEGLLRSTDGVLAADGETLLRRFDRSELEELLGGAGLELAVLQGDGVIADIISGMDAESESVEGTQGAELGEFEASAAEVPALRDIASRVHALARKPLR